MKIDAHHHFWRYDASEYGWIDESMAALRRDFLPPDLAREMAVADVEGVVSVQARQTVAETEWLLDLAEANDFILGVVGWLPLASDGLRAELERLSARPKLRAARHVLQDEPANELMDDRAFNDGVAALREFGLAYDILIHERHLPQAIAFVDRHPSQVFVLDHIAKPRIADGAMSPWDDDIRRLAERENVFCKMSGMVTEADWADWTREGLWPYMETVFEAFGAGGVMIGSDWPVCTLAATYGEVIETATEFVSRLSPDEQSAIWETNARRAYRLK